MCRATGRAQLAAGKTATSIALTDMRLTKLEVLGSPPNRTKAGGHHTATGKQEQAILEVRDRKLVHLPGKTQGEEVSSGQQA